MKSRIKNFFQKIANKKAGYLAGLVLICLMLFFGSNVKTALATDFLEFVMNAGVSIIMFFIEAITSLFGYLLILLMRVLVFLSQYNSFINNPFVFTGWQMLRDLVNMFFILGLLFIAFVTVLKIEKYSYNRLLAKLLIMAVLVNFSKTIAGVIIDFFQVIMLTFVNAYRDITGGNLFKGLGMSDWFNLNPALGPETVDWDKGRTSLMGSIFGLCFVLVSIIVILIFCVILAFRIVALWVLIVFSPLAFLSWTFGEVGGKIGQFANRWMSQFFEYCMVGPLIAFFLWLSISQMNKMVFADWVPSQANDLVSNDIAAGPHAMGRMDRFLQYMLAIITLVAGLKFAGEFKVVGASMAAGAANKFKDATAGRLERTARGAAGGVARYTGMAVKEGLGAVERGGGISGRLAKSARLVGTKEGRQTMGDRAEARIKGWVGRKPGALVEQRQKEIDRYQKEFEATGAKENPKILDEKLKTATGDRRLALMNIKGDQGKMDQETFQAALQAGDFAHYGIKLKTVKDPKTGKEKKEINFDKPSEGGSSEGGLANLEALSKKWEDEYEKKNGLRISISPFIRNPNTNEWEKVAPGEAGEKRKLKDIEDHLAKQGRDGLQKGISSGAFGASDDIMESVAHFSGASRNSYLKTAGKEAQNKYKEQLDDMFTIISGTDPDKQKLAGKLADKKNLKGTERQDFIKEKSSKFNDDKKKFEENVTLDQLKNMQEGYKVSTGEWEPGSGREITAGKPSDILTQKIREERAKKRGAYTKAKRENPDLIKESDAVVPTALKVMSPQMPLIDSKNALRQHFDTMLGKEKSSKLSDEVLEDYIKNKKEIVEQESVKSSFSSNISSQFSKVADQVGKGTGAKPNDINMFASVINQLITAMKYDVSSAGMSPEYFNFDKIEELKKAVIDMKDKPKAKQERMMIEILEDAKGEGFYTSRIPDYKKKKENGEGGGSTTPPATSSAPTPVIYDASGHPMRGGSATPEASTATATVNIVNNVTQNLTNATQQILGSNDNTALLDSFKRLLTTQLSDNLLAMQKDLGSSFDSSVAGKIKQKFADLEKVLSSGSFKDNQRIIETELPKIIDEIKKIEKTKVS